MWPPRQTKLARRMGSLNYLEGLLYRSASEHRPEETKTGIPLFDGTAHHFEQWKLRVLAKTSAAALAPTDKREYEVAQLASKILDGLTGDAASIAYEFGHEELVKPDGVARLVKLIEDEVMGHGKEAARELHDLGTRRGKGPLSRQHGETITSYLARRRRWKDRIALLDAEIKLPDTLVADYLLANARLNEQEKLSVKTCCNDELTVEGVTKQLKRLFRTKHQQ